MDRLKRNYNNQKRNNPYLSDLNCFMRSMKDGNYSMKVITDGLKKLVDKNDYPRSYFDMLLEQAIELNGK